MQSYHGIFNLFYTTHHNHPYGEMWNILWDFKLRPVPVTGFRSNSKFDKNLKCSSLKSAQPITTNLYTLMSLSLRVQNIIVVNRICFDPEYCKFHGISNSIEIFLANAWPIYKSGIMFRIRPLSDDYAIQFKLDKSCSVFIYATASKWNAKPPKISPFWTVDISMSIDFLASRNTTKPNGNGSTHLWWGFRLLQFKRVISMK